MNYSSPLFNNTNQATAKVARPGNDFFFQPKLNINQPGDVYEQEADRMADNVMKKTNVTEKSTFFKPSTGGSEIKRKCAKCEEEDKQIQRKPSEVNHSSVSKVNAGSDASMPTAITQRISNSSGNTMDSETQGFMKSKFGSDFSDVRIHTGSEAVQLSRDLNAKAFTTGSDIFFNEGQYQPGTDAGKHLLAHELTHVLQQQGTPKLIQRAEIDYRQLTWADFTGAAPKTGGYDAETYSNIHYPDLTTIKPKITDKETGKECTRKEGGKDITDKEYEAKISMDASGIKASAYMSQEKSYVKAVYKDKAAMLKACAADTFTKGEIAKCKSTLSKATSKRDSQCKTVSDGCDKAISDNQTYKITIGGQPLQAANAEECKQVVSSCNAGLSKNISYKTGSGKTLSTEAECDTVLTAECMKRKQDEADALLSHEQGHFDITNVIAKKLEADIKEIVNSYAEKSVIGCTKEEAVKKANEIVTKEVEPKIKDKIKEAQDKVDKVKGTTGKNQKVGDLKKTQDLYDSKTTHGKKVDEQAKWKSKIDSGNI